MNKNFGEVMVGHSDSNTLLIAKGGGMDSQVFCVEPGAGGEPEMIAVPELEFDQPNAKQWGASMAISNEWIAIGAPDSDTSGHRRTIGKTDGCGPCLSV